MFFRLGGDWGAKGPMKLPKVLIVCWVSFVSCPVSLDALELLHASEDFRHQLQGVHNFVLGSSEGSCWEAKWSPWHSDGRNFEQHCPGGGKYVADLSSHSMSIRATLHGCAGGVCPWEFWPSAQQFCPPTALEYVQFCMAVQGVSVHRNFDPLRSNSLDFAELPSLASVFSLLAYFCATVHSAFKRGGGGDKPAPPAWWCRLSCTPSVQEEHYALCRI